MPISRAIAGRPQLARLLQLILALKARRYPNARELAEFCEVSRRTVYRDLETLAIAGVLVRYRPEEQGYELPASFSLTPTGLDHREAAALLVLAQRWGQDGLGLGRAARTAAHKVMVSLPAEIRAGAHDLTELIRVLPGLFEPPPDRGPVYDAVLHGLASRRQLRIFLLDPGADRPITTRVATYRLVHSWSMWHLIGRSSLHRQVRTIAVPFVRKAEVLDLPYEIPPRFSLRRYLGRAWSIRRGTPRSEVILRFSPHAGPIIRDGRWHRTQAIEERPDGGVLLTLSIDGLDEIVPWLLGFGEDVTVIAPEALRRLLREQSERLARHHSALPRGDRPIDSADPAAILLNSREGRSGA